MPFLTDRMLPSPVSVVDACIRTFRESRLFRHTYTQASTRVLHSNRTSPIRIRRTNQALATTFWSPAILNDMGHHPSCRVREARVRCPFDEREGQNRSRHRPTVTMDHHSHPVIGASSENSALLDMTPRSSPKVLIAQTPDPLSAANEQYPPSFRQSFSEIQAHLFRKTTPGQHQTCHTPLLRVTHTGAFQKRP